MNSFLAGGDFCHLRITFANSLDPDQDLQYVGLELDPNCLTLKCCSYKNCLKNLADDNKSMKTTHHEKSYVKAL